jgi:pimeloyl-ACP methyl ester carboxylesterase
MKIALAGAIAWALIVPSHPLTAADYRATLTGHGFAPVNGTRLYYEIAGKGEGLVLIHGGNLDSRMWDDQFAPYAKRYRVVRYDVRGFGGSVRPSDQAYLDADDLAALLDYLELPKVHIIGLSLGGRIALDFAVTRPNRVLSLIVAGPGLSGFEQPDPAGEEAWWTRVQAARDQGSAKVVEMWLRDGYMAPAMEHPALAERLRYLSFENAHTWLENPILTRSPQPPTAKRLGQIKVPMLIVVGQRDVPHSHAIADRVARDVKSAKELVISKAGHMVNMENPADFDRAVFEFLNGVAQRPRLERDH